MTESAKTMVFAVIAAVSLGLAYWATTSNAAFDVEELVGQQLTETFDIEDPKSLKVVKFPEGASEPTEFEVAEVDGVWVIPSKEEYPSDATQQMAAATTGLGGRKILGIAAKSAKQHEQYGVIDPLSKGLKPNSTGVGTRVTLRNGQDEDLLDLIVGAEAKDTPGVRYARRANQDVVYLVELSVDSLSTDFSDWIEKDLLDLDSLKVGSVSIDDYSSEFNVVMTQQGPRPQVKWDRRSRMKLGYDRAASQWEPEMLLKFDADKEEFHEAPLAADEQLNNEALNELRDALDDLKIVDVVRKPEGLSADLKAGEDFVTEESVQNLVERGFAPVSLDGKTMEILSSEGEAICTMDDGVEYLLRFGDLKVDVDQAPSEGIHRYLFVMARHNTDALEEPEYEALPPLPSEPAKEPTAVSDDEAADESDESDEAEPAEETEEEEEEEEEESTEADSEEAAVDAAEAAAESDGGQDEPADVATEQPEPTLEEIKAERKRIEEENQRKRDQYEARLEAAKNRVKQLNERFGDWYYVIDESVYQKIHLGYDQLVSKKEQEETAEQEQQPPGESNGPQPLFGLPPAPSAAVPATDGEQSGP